MLPIALFENINRIPQGQPIDFLIWPITIAGIAALLVGFGESPEDIRELIAATAENPNNDPLLGAGIVQADAAVEEKSQRSAGRWFLLLALLGLGAVAFIAWERNRNA